MAPRRNKEFFEESGRSVSELAAGVMFASTRAATIGNTEQVESIVNAGWASAQRLAIDHFLQFISDKRPELREIVDTDITTIADDIKESILTDVRRNMDLEDTAKILRIELSATTSVSIAYETATHQLYSQLINHGIHVTKMWNANFNKATPPCSLCTALHGETIDIGERFFRPWGMYRLGYVPPAHPRCRCYVSYAVGGEAQIPEDPTGLRGVRFISAQDVRNMTDKVFNLVKRVIRSVRARFSRGSG